jgi:glucose-6-phosphate 1-dehydrogenase
LPVTCTEVHVQFRQPPAVYSQTPPPPNYLRFRISPDVEIALGVMVRVPREEMAGTEIELLAFHHPSRGEMDAYERLLGDALKGDATLFAREDSVGEAWRIVDPVLKAGMPVYEYEPKTWGPRQVDEKSHPRRVAQPHRDRRYLGQVFQPDRRALRGLLTVCLG